MAMTLYLSEGCDLNRIREAMYVRPQLELMVRCMHQTASTIYGEKDTWNSLALDRQSKAGSPREART